MAFPPRTTAISVENNFSRGLITEATAMNYPENSVASANNCVFLKTGKVIRRWGMDFEDTYAVVGYTALGIMGHALDPSNYFGSLSVVEYEWTTVANNGNIAFEVVQLGDTLIFYSIDNTNAISPNRKSFTVDLNAFRVTVTSDEGAGLAALPCSFGSGFGSLFVTHPLCNPFYVAYTPATDSITTAAITLQVRDFERINDTYDIDFRPASLTDAHKYNLYNQGWYTSAANATPATTNVLAYWDLSRADWPSNADIWWAYKNASELLDATWIDKTTLGNTPAPNGHYIYNAFSYTRNTTLGVTTLTDPSTLYRPACVAFCFGRVFYAGTPDNAYSSRIYFTKIVQGVTDFGVCYQQEDPTKENEGQLLEVDGGVIVIPDIALVYRILPLTSSLLIFASNGVWKITGPNGVFTANSYSVQKISSASMSSPYSVVVAEGLPFWWDQAGIYNIQYDPTSNQEIVVNVSYNTIQSLITSIPNANLLYVKGAYNNIDKTIHWLYRSTASPSISQNFNYDKLLVLSLTNQAFSPQTISSSVPIAAGLTFTSKSNNDVLLNKPGASVVKYLTVGKFGPTDTDGVTFSEFNRNTFLDWGSYGGIGTDYDSFFITGYRVRGELMRKFQSTYLVVILQQETNASCFVQGVWDYSNDPAMGVFTTSQQVFKTNVNRDYSRVKKLIRGNGYSLQFKFYSETGKPFTLVGWTSADSGTTVP